MAAPRVELSLEEATDRVRRILLPLRRQRLLSERRMNRARPLRFVVREWTKEYERQLAAWHGEDRDLDVALEQLKKIGLAATSLAGLLDDTGSSIAADEATLIRLDIQLAAITAHKEENAPLSDDAALRKVVTGQHRRAAIIEVLNELSAAATGAKENARPKNGKRQTPAKIIAYEIARLFYNYTGRRPTAPYKSSALHEHPGSYGDFIEVVRAAFGHVRPGQPADELARGAVKDFMRNAPPEKRPRKPNKR